MNSIRFLNTWHGVKRRFYAGMIYQVPKHLSEIEARRAITQGVAKEIKPVLVPGNVPNRGSVRRRGRRPKGEAPENKAVASAGDSQTTLV